ncbi:hypothetical protein ACQ33O_08565 [Ferruginibacter sp. SUN002]|uniref:hypothetical protein n=1 Tax=Ferruginibacter sp. SUN002 TaxID=2937789 RepID=UPI003D36DCA0
MRISFACLILLATIVSGCTKEKGINAVVPINDTIYVSEEFSSKPIAGAKVILKKCTQWDFFVGCTGVFSPFKTITTDYLGRAIFVRPNAIDELVVEHTKYWTKGFRSSISYSISLTPKCLIRAHLKKINSYSSTDALNIDVNGDCDAVVCWWRSNNWFPRTPTDTIVNVYGRAKYDNKISWYVNIANQDTLSSIININATDTADINIDY